MARSAEWLYRHPSLALKTRKSTARTVDFLKSKVISVCGSRSGWRIAATTFDCGNSYDYRSDRHGQCCSDARTEAKASPKTTTCSGTATRASPCRAAGLLSKSACGGCQCHSRYQDRYLFHLMSPCGGVGPTPNADGNIAQVCPYSKPFR